MIELGCRTGPKPVTEIPLLAMWRAVLIADPFDGDNEAAQQWIGDTGWRRETRLEWHAGDARRRGLVAYCLDTSAAIEYWHWTTQLSQAHAVRFGIEHFNSLTPHLAGTVYCQLNDSWPVPAIDFDGHRKPTWYAPYAAYAPRLATLQPQPSREAIG